MLDQEPERWRTWIERGLSCLEWGQAQESARIFRKLLQFDSSPLLHMALGESLRMLRQYEEAAAHFRQILHIDPQIADAYLSLAECLLLMHQHQEALETLETLHLMEAFSTFEHAGLATQYLLCAKKKASNAHTSGRLPLRA